MTVSQLSRRCATSARSPVPAALATASPAQQAWDSPLLQLLNEGVITGFACITSRGQVDASAGCLSYPQQQQGATANSSCSALPAVEDYLRLFNGVTPSPQTFDVCGERAVVSGSKPYTLTNPYVREI